MTRLRLLGLVGGLLALVGVGVVVLAVAGDDGSPSPAVEVGGRYSPAYAGLCSARSAARSGDVAAARGAFFDRAHQPLHELAAGATARDRSAAARLLEAKEAVEAGLAQAAPNLASDLDRLLAATASAVDAVGDPRPQSCPEGRT